MKIDELTPVRFTGAIAGTFSVIGSSIMMASFLSQSRKNWRSADVNSNDQQKLSALAGGFLLQLFWLSLSDFIIGIGFALSFRPYPTPEWVCSMQALMICTHTDRYVDASN